jgi:NADH:ubiquinone oxidoreductase subunit 2 (subunit N)
MMLYIVQQTYYWINYIDFIINIAIVLLYALVNNKNQLIQKNNWFYSITTYNPKKIKINKTSLDNIIYNNLTVLTCLLVLNFFIFRLYYLTSNFTSNGIFGNTVFNAYSIIFILLFVIIILLSNIKNCNYLNLPIEFNILIMFCIIGLVGIIETTDLISFYISLELQSMCLISLLSIQLTNKFNLESSIKFYLLSSISSGLTIISINGIFFNCGFTNITELVDYYLFINNENSKIFIWIWLFNIALLWKLGTAPMHIWFIDIVTSSKILPILIFNSIPKIAIISFMISKFNQFLNFNNFTILLLFIISSLTIAPISALIQTNIKSIIALSSVAQTGFLLFGLYLNQFYAVWFNLIVYNFALIFLFLAIKSYNNYDFLNNINGLIQINNWFMFNWLIIGLVLAGIPAIIVFTGKLVIMSSIISSNFIFGLIIITFSTIISVIYGINIIQKIVENKSNLLINQLKSNYHDNCMLTILGTLIISMFWYIKPIYYFCLLCFL